MKRIAVVLFAFSSGCGSPKPSPDLATTVKVLEVDLIIGSYNEEDYSLNAVHDLTVDHFGRMFVLQQTPAECKVFEPDGTYVRSIGRKGEGPGEFIGAGGLGWMGDSLWIMDNTNLRVSLYDTAGVFLRSFQPGFLPRNPDGSRILTNFPLSEGNTLGLVSPPPAHLGGDVVRARPLLRLSRDGTVIDTLALLPQGKFQSWEVRARNGGPVYASHPVPDGPLFDISPGGGTVVIVFRSAAAAEGGRFQVLALSSSGDTILSRGYSATPRPLTPADRERIINRIYNADPTTAAVIARETFEEALELPSNFPPVTNVKAGVDGSIWLRREEPTSDSVAWTVLGQTGNPLFTTHAPKSLAIYAADVTTVWGVLRDSLDVPYVVRYRVR